MQTKRPLEVASSFWVGRYPWLGPSLVVSRQVVRNPVFLDEIEKEAVSKDCDAA